MSSPTPGTFTADAGPNRAREKKRCQARSCWEKGTYVVVDGATDIATRLCRKHRKSFLGVSS